MNIENVVICCFKRDVHYAKACVASVRKWYPDIDVYLLKDNYKGEFNTIEIERSHNVKILENSGKYFGWGYAKLEIFFSRLSKCLILDSDTILTGAVIDDLNLIDSEFIFTGEENVDSHSYNVNEHYINVPKANKINSEYQFPGFVINTGQMVITPGLIDEYEFLNVINPKADGITEKFGDVFRYADQGLINYVIGLMISRKLIKVQYSNFWEWSESDNTRDIELEKLKFGKAPKYIIHWAGTKQLYFLKNTRSDLIKYFYDEYYKKVKFGKWKKLREIFVLRLIATLKIFKYLTINKILNKKS